MSATATISRMVVVLIVLLLRLLLASTIVIAINIYICIYACIYMCIYIRMYIHVYVHTYVYIYIHTHSPLLEAHFHCYGLLGCRSEASSEAAPARAEPEAFTSLPWQDDFTGGGGTLDS